MGFPAMDISTVLDSNWDSFQNDDGSSYGIFILYNTDPCPVLVRKMILC